MCEIAKIRGVADGMTIEIGGWEESVGGREEIIG